MAEAVGFIGLGIMGSRQAASLRRAGFELNVYNRTRERAEEWAAEHGGEVVLGERQVPVYDQVDALLRRHREVDPDVVEQRLRWLGEVVPIRGEPLYAGLARAQDALVIGSPVALRTIFDDVRRKLAIDGTTEVVHRCLPGTALTAAVPSVAR